ncbi:hypothetical protein [Halomonas urumqiensis]|uniref:Uncharacterized protein n=1 Tax=Halomonas urumqiensis TaxID=1684789 RepID=A0A2N7UKR5_9GAMM|nr:hypothetical protein [Halomonas urumqiensis]PMR81040.1 hypothetical protein C1H70_06505 [Halomonas urumqiensis]PTB01103.1 hypothetical protein C6V82_16880 [Halomonas urumqiensis]GHE22831.1 hypothetical protein GCM10017767_33520 [Halomonas urumqiensis]
MTMNAATAGATDSPIRSNVERFNRSGTPGYHEMVARGIALKERSEKNLQEIDNLPYDAWPFGLGTGPVHPIEQMPTLTRRLGRGRTAKLRAQFNGKPVTLEKASTTSRNGGNREKRIENTVRSAMRGRGVGDLGCPASDILSGIANLDHHNQKERNIPLNKISLYVILQEIDVITTREVKGLLDVGDRQARKYVKACEMALPFLERSLVTKDIQPPTENAEEGLFDYPMNVIPEDWLDDWIQTEPYPIAYLNQQIGSSF